MNLSKIGVEYVEAVVRQGLILLDLVLSLFRTSHRDQNGLPFLSLFGSAGGLTR